MLGLANGGVCLAYCLPVLFPVLLGQRESTLANIKTLARFLCGRLAGYLLIGLLAGFLGQALLKGPMREAILGVAYLALAVVMLFYGLSRPVEVCAGKVLGGPVARLFWRWPAVLPGLLGLLTGLNLCPPFMLAATRAAGTGSPAGGAFFFLSFFMGTSLYFLPTPFVGFLARVPSMATIGRLAAAVAALFYLYQGIIMAGGYFIR